jgi:hypothetical protein
MTCDYNFYIAYGEYFFVPREVPPPGKWVAERNSPKLRGARSSSVRIRLKLSTVDSRSKDGFHLQDGQI